MPRSNWYNQHPDACTCQFCEEKRHINSTSNGKIRRNEKCPCGSGKTFKKCHGQ